MEPGSRIALADGQVVTVRSALPSDAPALSNMLGKCDDDDLRMSRLASLGHDYEAMAASICRDDDSAQHALIGLLNDGTPIAFAGFTRDPEGHGGELDIIVASHLKRLGLGRAMLERLISLAHQEGLAALRTEVLVDNGAMIDLARRFGATLHGPDDGGMVELAIDTGSC